MPLLEIDGLSVRFGANEAVRDLSLSIEPGEVLGLVGESGSGKSVTSLAVLRLLDATARISGSIRFEGTELLALSGEAMRQYRGRRIAMIFQEPMTALNPVMRVGEQIAEAVRVHAPGKSREEVKRAVLEAMEAVAIPEPAQRYAEYPYQFSGGQRQRLLIAMAIVNRPQLLIADEPTTALDVTVQAQILKLLADLRHRYQLAMLFISHDLAVVSQVADRVAVMRGGWLLEAASRQRIFSAPRHAYTRSLLGAIPTLRTPRDHPLTTLPPMTDEVPGALIEVESGHWVRRGPE